MAGCFIEVAGRLRTSCELGMNPNLVDERLPLGNRALGQNVVGGREGGIWNEWLDVCVGALAVSCRYIFQELCEGLTVVAHRRGRMHGNQDFVREPFGAFARPIMPAPPLYQLDRTREPAAEFLVLVLAPT